MRILRVAPIARGSNENRPEGNGEAICEAVRRAAGLHQTFRLEFYNVVDDWQSAGRGESCRFFSVFSAGDVTRATGQASNE